MVNQSLIEKISYQLFHETQCFSTNNSRDRQYLMLTHFCYPSYRNLTLCSPNWGIWPGPLLVFWIEHASFWKISCPCMSVRKHWWFMIQFFKWEHEIIAKKRQWLPASLSCVCEVKSCHLSDQLSCMLWGLAIRAVDTLRRQGEKRSTGA